MGFYVNPKNQSKESFLIGHGIEIPSRTMSWDEVPAGSLPVVLVNNGHFTAAGIAYKPEELAEFTRSDDPRPRTIYIVKIEDLIEVCPDLYFAE